MLIKSMDKQYNIDDKAQQRQTREGKIYIFSPALRQGLMWVEDVDEEEDEEGGENYKTGVRM